MVEMLGLVIEVVELVLGEVEVMRVGILNMLLGTEIFVVDIKFVCNW
jgi:hypothetical protein